jgi:hypothetical protein
LLAALTVLALGVPAAMADQRTAQVLPFLNAERARNGLPAVTQINAYQELGCANHLRYMARNDGALVHGEKPSRPGYTPEGNFLNGPGGSEVLARAPGWAARSNPWATAPSHLYLLLNPAVVSTGYADDEDFVCQRMSTSPAGSAPLRFYAWTGTEGRVNVPYKEKAAERPYTPQQLVGISADRLTGPNLMVFSAGNLGTPVAAGIVGPDGAVDTRLVNEHTHNSVGDGSWFRGGGIIIPRYPLRPNTKYLAVVAWTNQGQARTQTFEFRTTKRSKAKSITLRVKRHGRNVTLKVPKPARGQTARVRVRARGFDHKITMTLKARQRIRLPLRAGRKRLNVTVSTFVADGQRYHSAKIKRTFG